KTHAVRRPAGSTMAGKALAPGRGGPRSMPAGPEALLRHIRLLAARPAADAGSDADLLGRFARTRDGGAFAALVERYGRLVRGVCRRVRATARDAEDAGQATWLVLARKAASLRRPDTLAAWLHGPARRIAWRCHRGDVRRRRREARAVPPAPSIR